jgi:type IV secretory pathway VirB10-like protein
MHDDDGSVPQTTPPAGSGLVPAFLRKHFVGAPMIASVVGVGILASSPWWFHPHAPNLQAMASAQMSSFGAGPTQDDARQEAPDPTATPWARTSDPRVVALAAPRTVVHTSAVASIGAQPVVAADPPATAAAVSPPTSDPPAPTRGSFVRSDDDGRAVAMATAVSVGYVPATSKNELQEGATIRCRLLTHVDSEQPGHVSAEVVEPVYSSVDPQTEVIPAGTHVEGWYKSATSSETRLVMVWTRLNFPNGRKFAIGEQPGTDELGGTGANATVNSGLGKLFGQALLYTALNAAGQAVSHASYLFQSSNVTQTFAGQQPTVHPTLYLDPPARFDIGVVHDLPLDEYQVRP